jgi:hypothetical protein
LNHSRSDCFLATVCFVTCFKKSCSWQKFLQGLDLNRWLAAFLADIPPMIRVWRA